MRLVFKLTDHSHEQAGGYIIDPTKWPNAIGKYINHAARGANLRLYPPVHVRVGLGLDLLGGKRSKRERNCSGIMGSGEHLSCLKMFGLYTFF